MSHTLDITSSTATSQTLRILQTCKHLKHFFTPFIPYISVTAHFGNMLMGKKNAFRTKCLS